MINIDFSADMRRMDSWAHRMGVDLREPRHLCEPYSLAQQHLIEMGRRLVQFHGFKHTEPTDRRILFTVVRDAPATRSVTLTPPSRVIELPIYATSFFSPERRLQWEHVFHSKLWFDRGSRVPGANIAVDLLHLLQCLLPGMLLVIEIQDGWSTQRGIPSLCWVREHRDVLVASMGSERFDALTQAAADVKRAVIDSRDMPVVAPSYSGF